MKPTTKHPDIDNFLTQIFGVDRKQSIQDNVCVICKGPLGPFRDELSRREAGISGCCQKCQDKVF